MQVYAAADNVRSCCAAVPPGKGTELHAGLKRPFSPLHVNLVIHAGGNITTVFSAGKVRHKEIIA